MKKLFLSATLAMLACSAFANVLVQYENQDAQGYFMKVKIDGAYKEVKIENGKISKLDIQGSNSACIFVTSCGEVEVNNGDVIIIKNRCITVFKTLQNRY